MKKVKILTYAKFQAVMIALAGIITGILYAGLGTIYDLQTIGLNYGTGLAYMAIPIMPLYFGAFGFVTGLVGATLYNLLIAKRISKVDLDFEQ